MKTKLVVIKVSSLSLRPTPVPRQTGCPKLKKLKPINYELGQKIAGPSANHRTCTTPTGF